jgi:hypothetical protein
LDYSELSNEAIKDRVQNSEEIYILENSKGWHLVQEACTRVARNAEKSLLNADPKDYVRIIELQQIVKLYKNVLGSIIKSFMDEGKIAFEEAKDRELIEKK